MAEIKIPKTDAPFGGQDNGIDVGKLEIEVNAATGIVVTSISTDATDIIFTYAATAPTFAAVQAVVQVHDGRPTKKGRLVMPGLPAYEGPPHHQSLLLQAAATGDTVVMQKVLEDCRIVNASLWVSNGSSLGDTVTVEIVDIDGITTTAGTVLMKPVDGLLLIPNGTGKDRMQISSGQAIPMLAGLYIRFTFTTAAVSTNTGLIAYWAEVREPSPELPSEQDG